MPYRQRISGHEPSARAIGMIERGCRSQADRAPSENPDFWGGMSASGC